MKTDLLSDAFMISDLQKQRRIRYIRIEYSAKQASNCVCDVCFV